MPRGVALRYLKLAVVPIWLPIAVLAITAIRFGRLPKLVNFPIALPDSGVAPRALDAFVALQEMIPNDGAAVGVLCVVMWLGAIPLSWAVYSLWDQSRELGYVCAAVLGPLTILTLSGGLDWPVQLSVGLSVTTMRILPNPQDALAIEDTFTKLANVVYRALADGPIVTRYALVFIPVSWSFALPAWYVVAIVRLRRRAVPAPAKPPGIVRTLTPFALSLWLPLGVLVLMIHVELFTFRGLSEPLRLLDIAVALLPPFVFIWLAAFPLSLAAYLLHARSRALAYVSSVPLAFLTIAFTTSSGLFGSMGILTYALACSLPAWLALGSTALIHRNRANARLAESA